MVHISGQAEEGEIELQKKEKRNTAEDDET